MPLNGARLLPSIFIFSAEGGVAGTGGKANPNATVIDLARLGVAGDFGVGGSGGKGRAGAGTGAGGGGRRRRCGLSAPPKLPLLILPILPTRLFPSVAVCWFVILPLLALLPNAISACLDGLRTW